MGMPYTHRLDLPDPAEHRPRVGIARCLGMPSVDLEAAKACGARGIGFVMKT